VAEAARRGVTASLGLERVGELLMNSIGMTRRIDALGRIVVPAELRRLLEIRVGDLLDIRVEGGNVVLAKVEKTCVFCGSGDSLRPYHDKRVCNACVERLTGSYRPPKAAEDGIATASS
jgi:transcriptional pleiotropic regulator of transition state genes